VAGRLYLQPDKASGLPAGNVMDVAFTGRPYDMTLS